MPEESIIVNGLEHSDKNALNEKQRKDLRQLKVDAQKIDEQYVREHPELDVMCFEFIREVLHRRPTDFYTFAAAWFANENLPAHIKEKMDQLKNPSNRDLDF